MYHARSFKQERARLTADLRAEGKTRVEVAEALRWARGWSQRQVADEWCRRWPDDLKTGKNISYWETWPQSGHAPSLGTLDRLAQLYECDVADLVADLPGYRHRDPAHRAPALVVHPSPFPVREPTPVDGGTAQTPRAGAPLPSALLVADGSRPVDVPAIRAMSDAFQAADRRLGGGVLYGSVVRYLNQELAPQLLASTGDTAETEMFAAAASLTEAAGWMAHDGGNDRRARDHLTRAFKLASVAGTPTLVGNVCGSMSHLACHLGQPSEAVRLADMGLNHVKDVPDAGRLVARLHAMHALGMATQGHTRGCLEALERAEQVLHTSKDAPGSAWVSHFDEGSLASEAATCLRRLHALEDAERHARRAIELRDGDRVRSRSLAQITLAHVLADSNRIDEAASIGTAVCETARSLASARVARQLDGLCLALADHASLTTVADFLTAVADTRPADVALDGPAPWPT
jgi:transcriptional regulator with XRE-family HTH domain